MILKNRKRIYIFLFIYVSILMLFCAGSSPLIDNMQVVDGSVFFCIGRSMVAGKVPYRDLFDHKGLYLYFFNYLGALISQDTTIGLFIVETIFMFINSVLLYEIAEYLFKNIWKNLLFVCIMLGFFLNFSTYQSGDYAETFCITFQLISILLLLKFFDSGSTKHSPIYMLIHGICVGIVFNMKANLILMWGGIAIGILGKLIIEKQYKNMFDNICFGLLGIVIGVIPVILYCLINECFIDMINDAFLFSYLYISDSIPVIQKIKNIIFPRSAVWVVPLSTISIILLCKTKIDKWKKTVILLSFIFSVICVYMAARAYMYYYEYIIVFLIPLVYILISRCSHLIINRKLLLYLSIPCLFFLTIRGNMNWGHLYITTSEKDTISHVCSYIKENIENYDNVFVSDDDAIYYNKLNVIPQCKYFFMPHPKQEMKDQITEYQKETIYRGDYDVIVCRSDHKHISSFGNKYIKCYEYSGEEVWILNSNS